MLISGILYVKYNIVYQILNPFYLPRHQILKSTGSLKCDTWLVEYSIMLHLCSEPTTTLPFSPNLISNHSKSVKSCQIKSVVECINLTGGKIRRNLEGGGGKMENIWKKKKEKEKKSPRSTLLTDDNTRGLIKTKQTKPRSVYAAPHPITPAYGGGGGERVKLDIY